MLKEEEKMVQLNITPSGQAYLVEKGLGTGLFLDFVDGDSPAQNEAISCTLGVQFRLISVVDAVSFATFAKYQVLLPTELGDVGVKESSLLYLDQENVLDFSPQMWQLQLKGESGILATKVPYFQMKGGKL